MVSESEGARVPLIVLSLISNRPIPHERVQSGCSCLSLFDPVLLQPHRSDGKKRSDPEWRGALSPLEYDVLRQAGTERPFTGEHTSVFPSSGHYACKGCGTALYSSESKFEASCGWPAFDKAYKGTVRVRLDSTHGMTRWEILCAACDGHLGHVFTGEGYTPTSQRHCVNSVSMVYTEDEVESPETAFDFAAYGSGTDTN